MDALRGLSIILVATGHALASSFHDTGVVPPPAVEFFLSITGPLRMPLMVFLSGMLVPRALTKGAQRFVAGKVKAVLWPYFVWSLIFILLLYLMTAAGGSGFGWGLFGRIFYSPIEHLWFLAYLFIYFILALLMRSLPAYVPVLLAAAASVVAFGSAWQEFTTLALFFSLGVSSAVYTNAWTKMIQSPLVLGTTTAVAASALVALAILPGVASYQPQYSLVVLLGIVSVCAIASRFDLPGGCRALKSIGRDSLTFYIVHMPVLLIFTTVARQAVPGYPLAVLVLSLVVSLVVSAIVCRMRKFTLIDGLFVLRLRKRSSKGREARVPAVV
ncbi:acyltransferase family protein [Cryobacterium roopkundense]|uniref:Fucose 4-O-acetylase-like acetyltransferase n=1 Tax=Cryobacterium roopkundense TaxID=1001240 RepID=A0A7W8ZY49_9MICO|nr:acyltransferase [Cryobacterium roopkundense]MBB5642389.1 fucose 4-O-acetylase-like acetyltransferase [Cryobacterium roopkundense]